MNSAVLPVFAPAQALHSPFRYPGGKFYLRQTILPKLPAHSWYGEPFSGGGSIFFLKSKAETSFLNDLDSDLMTCFQAIRDDVDPLVALVTTWAITPQSHAFVRDEYVPQGALERAARFYFLNRTSYSGITTPYNCHWGKPRKPINVKWWARRLWDCHAKLQDVKLTSVDFEEAIEAAPDGAFLFLDPPFAGAYHKKYYAHTFAEADHIRLADCLRRQSHRLRLMVTYDDHPLVRHLYDWMAQSLAIPRRNHIASSVVANGRPVRDSVGSELILRNYD